MWPEDWREMFVPAAGLMGAQPRGRRHCPASGQRSAYVALEGPIDTIAFDR